MMSPPIDIFLSCSLKLSDEEKVIFFRELISGIGFSCHNVDGGSSDNPSVKARDLISKTSGLIAICTARGPASASGYQMPEAVREEIAMAYAMEKPILIIGEDVVSYNGFMDNFCTRLIFSHSNYKEGSFLGKLNRTLVEFKDKIGPRHQKQFPKEYFIETYENYIGLEKDKDALVWKSLARKKLVFKSKFNREIVTRVWPSVELPDLPKEYKGKVEIKVHESSRGLTIKETVEKLSADAATVDLKIIPDPQAGDYIEFSRSFESAYLNPIFLTREVKGKIHPLLVDGKEFYAFDGVTPTEEIKKLILHFSFPGFYPLTRYDIAPFAYDHGVGPNYQEVDESKRLKTSVHVHDRLTVEIEVDNPLSSCMYGLAWNPPDA